jgi:hypothetical protein
VVWKDFLGSLSRNIPHTSGRFVSMFGVLSKVSSLNVILQPYPHVVVRNAIDEDLFKQLDREFPRRKLLLGDRLVEDKMYEYSARKIVCNPAIHPIWREFVSYHISRKFFKDILRVFGAAIPTLHPSLEQKLGKPLNKLTIGMRDMESGNSEKADEVDLAMDCQFYLNYTRSRRRIAGPHIDRGTQFYGAMLYFRDPADNSFGGDFQICEANNYAKLFISENAVNETEVKNSRVVKTVKYEANTLVFFLNSAKSIHAVSPRSATPFIRRHINICGDLFILPGEGLFNVCRPVRASASREHGQQETYEIVQFRLPDN